MIKIRILGNLEINDNYCVVDSIIYINNKYDDIDLTIKEFTDNLRTNCDFIGNVYVL